MGIGRIRYASHRHVHRRVVDTHVVLVAFELGKIDVLQIVIYLSYLCKGVLVQWVIRIYLQAQIAHLLLLS